MTSSLKNLRYFKGFMAFGLKKQLCGYLIVLKNKLRCKHSLQRMIQKLIKISPLSSFEPPTSLVESSRTNHWAMATWFRFRIDIISDKHSKMFKRYFKKTWKASLVFDFTMLLNFYFTWNLQRSFAILPNLEKSEKCNPIF